MKDLVPPPPIVHDQFETVKTLFNRHVVPSYGRFDLAFARGSGSSLWDVTGKRYLDLGGGIAVCALGHAHPAITEALVEQSGRLVHVSNLYYTEPQGRLAEAIVKLIGPGKVFFSNSGGEANEGLFKLARKFGQEEGRFEILTALNSFHGRTLAGISATGQEKVKRGFEPMVPGFRHVPFNDLDAMRRALSPSTVAILIEGVQGEGGITPATPEYLRGLRRLCDEKNLLLFMDGVQCGQFRTGRFQSYQRILEDTGRAAGATPTGAGGSAPDRPAPTGAFLPDGVSMAKSLGGGFPIGAFWVRGPYADLLGPGMHATTYGGTPLACAVALRVLAVIERDHLADNARQLGEFLKGELLRLAQAYPGVIRAVRGLGLMIGIELAEREAVAAFRGSEKTPAIQVVHRLHEAGVLTIPAGAQVVRLLPALNLTLREAQEGLAVFERVLQSVASG